MHLTVGVDGSVRSMRALSWAVDEAAELGCDVEIVYACQRPPSGATDVVTALNQDDHGRGVLNRARHQAGRRDAGVKTWSRYEIGTAAQALLDAGRDAEMVVVGKATRRRTKSSPGPTIMRLVTELPRPVCVIPDIGELRGRGPVVVGVDDSGCGVAAMRFGRAEALRRGACLRAVRAVDVLTPVGTDGEDIGSAHGSWANAAMTLIDEVWWLTGRTGNTDPIVQHLVQEGRPADVLIRSASGAQMIVVGSHGRGLLRRTLLGSVSRQVVQETEVPVIVVKTAVTGEVCLDEAAASARADCCAADPIARAG